MFIYEITINHSSDFVVWLFNETGHVLDNNTVVKEMILISKLNNDEWCRL